MLFQVMIYNFRGPWGPSSPSNAPRNSPQILLFLVDERQIAAQKTNEMKNCNISGVHAFTGLRLSYLNLES